MYDFKRDYQKLIDTILQKEDDLKTLGKELDEKNLQIQEFDGKMLSIFVLEFKIKELSKTYQSDLDNLEKKHEKELKKLKKQKLLLDNNSNTNEKTEVDSATNLEKIKNFRFRSASANKKLLKNLNNKLRDSNQNSIIKDNEIISLKSNLTEKNKEINLMSQMTEQFFFFYSLI